MIKIKIKDIQTMAMALINIVECERCDYGEGEALDIANKVISGTTDEFERGYQQALRDVHEEKFRLLTIDGEPIEVINVVKVQALALAHRENEMNLEREIEI